MNDTTGQNTQTNKVDNIADLIVGISDDNPVEIEIAVTADNKVVLFYDKEFSQPIQWFEFNVESGKLDFIFEDGKVRDVMGMALANRITKYMHNAHQILTVFMDDKTGEAKEGNYIPLIIHSA